MADTSHPILRPRERSPSEGKFDDEEVGLAHRNHGLLLEGLRHDVTPMGMHYLLTHFDVPFVANPEDWTLSVGGLVDTPLQLRLAEIQSMPQVTHRVTLECAGNGRSLHMPRWPSQPWHHEAVGTAEWTGTPLAGVLARAGLKKSVQEVVFLGADRGFDSGVEHNFGRSLSRAAAMGEDVLLVTAMNGQPLLPQHGAPLRLIVPGWYGMASVKWLDTIEAIDHAFEGYQQVRTYMYRERQGDAGVPVTTVRVKSLLVPPGIPDWYTRMRLVDRGLVRLSGRAWSGGGVTISKVDVLLDGRPHAAELGPVRGPYAWRGWHFDWDATPGEHELACRATDANGNVQPLTPPPDRAGFGNNTVHRVSVTVR